MKIRVCVPVMFLKLRELSRVNAIVNDFIKKCSALSIKKLFGLISARHAVNMFYQKSFYHHVECLGTFRIFRKNEKRP